MVKIDNKLHLVGKNFELIESIILSDMQDKIKVIQKNDFGLNFSANEYAAIVLMDKNKNILGKGSACGKINLDAIIAQYKIYEASKMQSCAPEQINLLQQEEELDNLQKNSPKIDPKSQNEDSFEDEQPKVEQDNDDKIDDDLSRFFEGVNTQEQNDQQSLPQESDIQNEENNIQKEQSEVVLKKEDNIDKGVDFIMQNFEEKESKNDYYTQIKSDLDKFFQTYPKNEELESRVWGSKWVKVVADYDYSVGVIFEDDTPSIIAYAVPYDDIGKVENENFKFGEWLKIDNDSDSNRGYFVHYQNILTGEMILDSAN